MIQSELQLEQGTDPWKTLQSAIFGPWVDGDLVKIIIHVVKKTSRNSNQDKLILKSIGQLRAPESAMMLIDAFGISEPWEIMYEAAIHSRLDVLDHIVDKLGYDVDEQNEYGWTVLREFLVEGPIWPEVVTHLLKLGARTEWNNYFRPVQMAAELRSEIGMLRVLLDSDAHKHINELNAQGKGTLHVLLYGELTRFSSPEDLRSFLEILKFWLEAGANPNQVTNDREETFPLHLLAGFVITPEYEKSQEEAMKLLELIQILVAAGARTDAVNGFDQTPLELLEKDVGHWDESGKLDRLRALLSPGMFTTGACGWSGEIAEFGNL